MAHFLPCTKAITSEETTEVVMREVFRHHSLPDSIINYNPQTDRQAEQTNQTLEQYLWCFLSYQQDDWVDLLQFAEFAYNNSIQPSTRVTPFYAYRGYHP